MPAPVSLPAFSQYEFSYSDNLVIGNLGSKMSFVGLFMLGIGLFFFVSVLIRWVQSHHLEVALLLLTLLLIVVGIWTHRAGREFRGVAETHGKDVSHLIGALGNLLRLYTLLYMLFFIALVFAIIQLGRPRRILGDVRQPEKGRAWLGRVVHSQGSSERRLAGSRPA